MTNLELGNLILKYRKQKNLSQEDLAKEIGVTRQTISKWELNETSPDLKQAVKLAEIFNIDFNKIINIIKDEETKKGILKDKIKKITCKVGEEKNLVAVLHCDNDFGTFTLQKQGTLELPNSIKDNIAKTKIVVIKTHDNKTITIKEENEINILLSVINNSKVWTGPVTTPSPLYKMNLFDSSNKRIAEILYNPGNYFSIEINNKSYELTNIDKESLNTILSK